MIDSLESAGMSREKRFRRISIMLDVQIALSCLTLVLAGVCLCQTIEIRRELATMVARLDERLAGFQRSVGQRFEATE